MHSHSLVQVWRGQLDAAVGFMSHTIRHQAGACFEGEGPVIREPEAPILVVVDPVAGLADVDANSILLLALNKRMSALELQQRGLCRTTEQVELLASTATGVAGTVFPAIVGARRDKCLKYYASFDLEAMNTAPVGG